MVEKIPKVWDLIRTYVGLLTLDDHLMLHTYIRKYSSNGKCYVYLQIAEGIAGKQFRAN